MTLTLLLVTDGLFARDISEDMMTEASSPRRPRHATLIRLAHMSAAKQIADLRPMLLTG